MRTLPALFPTTTSPFGALAIFALLAVLANASRAAIVPTSARSSKVLRHDRNDHLSRRQQSEPPALTEAQQQELLDNPLNQALARTALQKWGPAKVPPWFKKLLSPEELAAAGDPDAQAAVAAKAAAAPAPAPPATEQAPPTPEPQPVQQSPPPALEAPAEPTPFPSTPFTGPVIIFPFPFPESVGFEGNGTELPQRPLAVESNKLLNTKTAVQSNCQIGASSYERRWNPTDDKDGTFYIWDKMGSLSPYQSSRLFPELQQWSGIPDNCHLESVQLLHRSGLRLPSSAGTFGENLQEVGRMLLKMNHQKSAKGALSFLNNWQYNLGSDLLSAAGRQQMFDSGVAAFTRYGKLYSPYKPIHKPIIRTASTKALLDSAKFFNLGFFGIDAPALVNLEVLIDSAGFNSTLSPWGACPNVIKSPVGDLSLAPRWIEQYTKNAIKRLQPLMPTGTQLTPEIIHGMQSLCAVETQALGYSDFCGLFTKAEWEGFQYAWDLRISGNAGPQSTTGRAQGIGWVQELLARLQGSTVPPPITSQNSSHSTLPLYFPGDQSFYFDFAHDGTIVGTLMALGFKQLSEDLDPAKINSERKFLTSSIVPSAAKLAVEVLQCAAHKKGGAPEKYIRAVLNDAVLPMGAEQGCTDSRPNPTLCKLNDFLSFQYDHAIQAANFDAACRGG
ncbi:Multiple inositol polyphosphate phosphatase [Ceraceosorus bombacis]|uniref:Multiple inositol polyphosphate phosphatase n=1 Tax=Ceraceosorus bombacis TaxID=401625 RepID=A0A0P1BCL6_9BASI|nr:Multiple inositol polyphosphate phosphatase [Ceraceosorus bombacis]